MAEYSTQHDVADRVRLISAPTEEILGRVIDITITMDGNAYSVRKPDGTVIRCYEWELVST